MGGRGCMEYPYQIIKCPYKKFPPRPEVKHGRI